MSRNVNINAGEDDNAGGTPVPELVSELVVRLKEMRRAERFLRESMPSLRRLWPAGTHEIYRTGGYSSDPLLMVNHDREDGLSFDLIDAPSISTVDSYPDPRPSPGLGPDIERLDLTGFLFRPVNPDVPSPGTARPRNGRPAEEPRHD